MSAVKPGSRGIAIVSIVNFIICLLYMELALFDASWLPERSPEWLKHFIEHWLGLTFAVYAFIMLFGVDRRKWAEKFEYNRRINNFMLVLAPCVAEALEPWREKLFEWVGNNKDVWTLLMVFVVWALLAVLVFYLEKRFHLNERTNIT